MFLCDWKVKTNIYLTSIRHETHNVCIISTTLYQIRFTFLAYPFIHISKYPLRVALPVGAGIFWTRQRLIWIKLTGKPNILRFSQGTDKCIETASPAKKNLLVSLFFKNNETHNCVLIQSYLQPYLKLTIVRSSFMADAFPSARSLIKS